MMRIRPYLARAFAMFRSEPALALALFVGLWVPQAVGWLLARGVAQAGFHQAEAAGAAALVSLPFAIAAPAFAGGVMALFGEAVRGRTAGWDAFRDGTARYYWRVLGGWTLVVTIAVLVTGPVFAAVARRQAVELGSGLPGLAAAPSLELVRAVLAEPALAVPFLVGLLIDFLFVYWAPAVVLGERTTFAAAASSMRFAVRAWLPTVLAVLANFLVAGALHAGVRALVPGALVPFDEGPLALGQAARAATVAALGVTSAAVLLQAVWEALYRSYLWTLYHGAGVNAG